MTRFLIRFLGGFFAFVGLGALADSAVANGVCDGVKLHYVSNGAVGETNGVVSYTNESGAGWYVGWPNSGYSEMDYGPRTLWYDMDGYDAFFDGRDAYHNQSWRFPWRVGPAADSKLQNGCILAPELDRICTSYYSGVTVAGYFCAGCAIPIDVNGDTMPGVLFAEGTGLFQSYGCCQYGVATGTECPCFFASTLSGVTVTDMDGDKHTAPTVVPQIYTYNFLNCQADAYQGMGSDGYSYVLPWVSAEDASGAGTGMLKGRVKFVYQPGFWADGPVGSTDQFVSYSVSSCTFSNVYLDGVYGVAGGDRCATSGCADITQSSGFWFNPSACYSCRTLDDNYSSNSGKMVFEPTVSTTGAGAFLRSTFGPESCYLEKIGPIEGTNGSYEYSCDSYYTE